MEEDGLKTLLTHSYQDSPAFVMGCTASSEDGADIIDLMSL